LSKLEEHKEVQICKLKKQLRYLDLNIRNSKSIWHIELKFCTLPTDMFCYSLLNFNEIWRWSPGKVLLIWPISNGMTLLLNEKLQKFCFISRNEMKSTMPYLQPRDMIAQDHALTTIILYNEVRHMYVPTHMALFFCCDTQSLTTQQQVNINQKAYITRSK